MKKMRTLTKHTLVAWMEDKPGVLARVASLIRRRNFNIESLAVGHSETPAISRMTLVVDGTRTAIDQVVGQLQKQINVTEVVDVTEHPMVIREMALIRVKANAATRPQIVQLVDIYRAKIVDVARESMIIEVTGPETRVDSLILLLEDFGIMEMVRTGRIVMVRGENGQSGYIADEAFGGK
jgi:acetolactate synthase-1/3 small subunit